MFEPRQARQRYMRLWIKISCIVFLILIILSLSLILSFVYLPSLINTKGKSLLADKLKETFKKEVSIGRISLVFPFNLIIEDIEVRDLFKIDEVFVQGSAIDILKKKIILSELRITRAVVNIEKSLNTMAADTLPIERDEKTPALILDMKGTPLSKGEFLSPSFYLKHLIINNSTWNLVDKSIKDKTITITIKDLNINVENLNFPMQPANTTFFQLNGRIPWQQGIAEGKISLSGRVDLYKKDIQAKLEIKGIDGVYLHPYYSDWVDLENSRIKEASFDFNSDIQGKNNDVVVQCRLELADIEFRPRSPEEFAHKAEKITRAVLDIFRKLNEGRVVLNFTVKTKMDKPEFDIDIIRAAVDNVLSQGAKSDKIDIEDVALVPGRLIEGVTKETSKAIIDGAISVGKSLTDAILDAFKKPEEEVKKTEVSPAPNPPGD